MKLDVRRLDASRHADFFTVHSGNECDQCYCVAWWVPTWAEWDHRTPAQNRQLREDLLRRGVYDGYLLYVDDRPAGWCQVGPRDQWPKLTKAYRLPADPHVWAVTCFQIQPTYRGQGLSTQFLQKVIEDLRYRGVKRVEAFPARDAERTPEALWNGTVGMYQRAGFAFLVDDPAEPIMTLILAE